MLSQTIYCNRFWNQRKIEKVFFFKLPYPYCLQIFSANGRGGWIFFKLRQLLNFSPISKQMAPNCSEEQSPYSKIPKKNGIHHISWGSPSTFISTIFLGVSWNSRPPYLIWWIPIFYVFSYKGIILLNNLVPFVLKSEKNLVIDAISK